MFGALLLRFGRVDGERAVLSLDGEVEGILSGSEARSQVAADISCAVEAGEVPDVLPALRRVARGRGAASSGR